MQTKQKRWQATIAISASGPEHTPLFRAAGRRMMPRAVADLDYTTADSDYLQTHFKRRDNDSCEFKKFFRLVNPTAHQVLKTFDKIEFWFSKQRRKAEWDGGAIQVVYAGHGCETEGEMVLKNDSLFSPKDLIEQLLPIARRNERGERLRLSLVLDSCHSGEFGLRILDMTLNKYADYLVPFNVVMSCCPDESSYEDPDLGHGIFTYCFSSYGSIGSIAAQAIQPNNTFGPSLSIASGEHGVGLLTGGAQNPVTYFNGAGHLEIGNTTFSILDSDACDALCMSHESMRRQVIECRNSYEPTISGIGKLRAKRISSSEARLMAKQLRLDLSPSGKLNNRKS